MLLGHIVYKDGVLLDPSKIAIIVDLPMLTSVHVLRVALGHIGYYRKFMCNYEMIIVPLEKLLKKESHFHWSDQCEKAFDQLKEKLVLSPILIFPY